MHGTKPLGILGSVNCATDLLSFISVGREFHVTAPLSAEALF